MNHQTEWELVILGFAFLIAAIVFSRFIVWIIDRTTFNQRKEMRKHARDIRKNKNG